MKKVPRLWPNKRLRFELNPLKRKKDLLRTNEH